MICNQCGSEIPEGQQTCFVCGAYINGTGQMNQQNGYSQQVIQNRNAEPELGMKWFKFIIWVQLFVNALFNIIGGIVVMTGAHYNNGNGNVSDLIYMTYDGLKTLDIVYGVAALLLAAGAIVVRFMLAGFKANGPVCYYVLMGLNIVVALAYAIIASSVTHFPVSELLTASDIRSFIINAAMICINMIYFGKRKHMFVY